LHIDYKQKNWQAQKLPAKLLNIKNGLILRLAWGNLVSLILVFFSSEFQKRNPQFFLYYNIFYPLYASSSKCITSSLTKNDKSDFEQKITSLSLRTCFFK
jgi:hypothetical protein